MEIVTWTLQEDVDRTYRKTAFPLGSYSEESIIGNQILRSTNLSELRYIRMR